MNIPFYKFDGAGNDFVLIDARQSVPHFSPEAIAHICHRRFGVGADGLMTLHSSADYDFEMRYYNSDGHPATMCGNGARCITIFAHLLGIKGESEHLRFLAPDGPHEAQILSWDPATLRGVVSLGMKDVPLAGIRQVLDGTLLNTGVPHYVQQVHDLPHFDVVGEGRRIRHLPDLGPEGANVNFIEPLPDGTLRVRTYERGVEDETLSCGTGVTACALALAHLSAPSPNTAPATTTTHLLTPGGTFQVTYTAPAPNTTTTPNTPNTAPAYTHILLTGPVSLNFQGTLPAPHL